MTAQPAGEESFDGAVAPEAVEAPAVLRPDQPIGEAVSERATGGSRRIWPGSAGSGQPAPGLAGCRLAPIASGL